MQFGKPIYLFGFLMVLFLTYTLLFWLCAHYSKPLFDNQFDIYDDMSEQKLFNILINMSSDNTYCFDCISYHIGSDILKAFIKKQSLERKKKDDLKIARTIYNIISIVTSLITFVIFGGPKLIVFIQICCSCFIFISVYIENISHVIILEVIVVFSSLIVFQKCCYAIHFALIVVLEKKRR
jgi:hypothetical protein